MYQEMIRQGYCSDLFKLTFLYNKTVGGIINSKCINILNK